MRKLVLITLLTVAPMAAQAFDRISERAAFLTLIAGKSLSNRLYGVALQVSQDGRISGAAIGKPISGSWAWENGYFCRSMAWGSTEIPYNFQLVEARGDRMRFTSDQGNGDTATFKLR